MNTPPIRTERLILRKFTKADLNALYLILCDEEVNRFLPWFPIKTLQETALFFKERYESAYLLASGYHYAVCLKEDNLPIGYLNVGSTDSFDFGYGLRR